MSLNDYEKAIHDTAVEKGFWTVPGFWDQIGNKLALVHSEVTEILEALRKNQGQQAVSEEFADVFIRLIDVYAVLKQYGYVVSDLDDVISAKIEKNAGRPVLHGNVFG